MDHAAFLEAIVADPEDDAPRLVYADWLEERGDPRGTFVRLQCALERANADDPRRGALEDEAEDLLAQHQAEWTAPLQGRARDWRFRRGFVEWVECEGPIFLDRAASWFPAFPLRGLRLNRLAPDDVPSLAAEPHLGRLESLDFRGPFLRDSELRALLASPHLGRLTALLLRGQRVEAGGVQALVDSRLMPRLRLLDLSANRAFGDRAIRVLAAASSAADLRTLGLAGTNLTARGVADLFGSSSLKGLRELDLCSEMRRDLRLFVEAVARSDTFRNLTSLNLGNHGLEVDQWRQLLSATGSGLSRLEVPHCDLEDAGVQAIVQATRTHRLTVLNLRQNRIHSAGVENLVESPALAPLTVLNLASNDVQDTGAKALAASQHLTRLEKLDLAGNLIGGPGLRALAESRNLVRARELDLSNNYVGTVAIRALADSPNLSRLRKLRLSANRAEPEWATTLTKSPHLNPRLRLELTAESDVIDARPIGLSYRSLA